MTKIKALLCKKIALWLCLPIIIVTAAVSAPLTLYYDNNKAESRSAEPIIVLYTNDIHCAVEESEEALGFAGLATIKDWAENITCYVTLADCGDAIQGEAIGTLSNGEYMVEMMNQLGYDVCTLGNHEFDYGIEQIEKIMQNQTNAKYVDCNFYNLITNQTVTSPYVIIDYDGVSAAYVGITTPDTITSSKPSYFMDENGNYIYGFCQGDDGQNLYTAVQTAVDAARLEGADYVIALSHLGIEDKSQAYRSTDVIANTAGIDVMLDGHSHSVIEGSEVLNKDGEKVLLSSTGTKLANVGCLKIDTKATADKADDSVTTTLLSKSSYMETNEYIREIKSGYDELLNTVAAQSEVKLSMLSEAGNRIVRSRETSIGNFCADAFRALTDADIAVVNGGGIRDDLPAGEITNNDIINVFPFGNMLCVVECTGQEILDMLEMAYKNVQTEYENAGGSVGEYGGFQQISGMRLTIDTSIESSVELDENGLFKAVLGKRRVKDVQILNGETGEYEPINADKTYSLASHNYMLHSGGDGINIFEDNKFIIDEFMLDNQALIKYITDFLNGRIGAEYGNIQNRITVK